MPAAVALSALPRHPRQLVRTIEAGDVTWSCSYAYPSRLALTAPDVIRGQMQFARRSLIRSRLGGRDGARDYAFDGQLSLGNTP